MSKARRSGRKGERRAGERRAAIEVPAPAVAASLDDVRLEVRASSPSVGLPTVVPPRARRFERPVLVPPPRTRRSSSSLVHAPLDLFQRLRAGIALAMHPSTRAVRIAGIFGVALPLIVAAIWLASGDTAHDWVVRNGQKAGLIGGVPAQTTRGIEALDAGDPATARRELEQAARDYRHSAVALVYLAQIRGNEGDLGGARADLEEAVRREPDNPLPHRLLGELHLTRARSLAAGAARGAERAAEVAAAEAQFTRTLALDPLDLRARGFQACTLASLGRTAEAADARAAAGLAEGDGCAPSSTRAVASSRPLVDEGTAPAP